MLTTFTAHVAERQATVIECFGAFRVKETYSADEPPAAQRKAKVTMTFDATGVIKIQGGVRMLDEGLDVRDVRRAIAQTLKAKGAEKGKGSRTEDGAGASGVSPLGSLRGLGRDPSRTSN